MPTGVVTLNGLGIAMIHRLDSAGETDAGGNQLKWTAVSVIAAAAVLWIRLGPLQFQPGEIVKITLAVFFAGYLSSNRDLILLVGKKIGRMQFPRVKDMGPMVTAWVASVGVLVFQHDLGMPVLFFGLLMVMIYVAASRVSWLLLGLALMAAGGYAAANIFLHVRLRVDAWINPFWRRPGS